jgi:hypothetical protein
MSELEFISNTIPYISTFVGLTGLLAITSAVLTLPVGTVVTYTLAKDLGFKDGKSAVKCMWVFARNVDLKDIFGKRKLNDSDFNEKYKSLGIEKYFIS